MTTVNRQETASAKLSAKQTGKQPQRDSQVLGKTGGPYGGRTFEQFQVFGLKWETKTFGSIPGLSVSAFPTSNAKERAVAKEHAPLLDRGRADRTSIASPCLKPPSPISAFGPKLDIGRDTLDVRY